MVTKQGEDIAVIKTEMGFVKDELKNIKTNHIQHIYTELEKIDGRLNQIEKKIAYYIGGLALLTFLIQVGIKFI